jgi:Ca-activated chloride channel family protein
MTTIRIRPDRSYIRTGYRSNRFLLIELEAPAAPPRDTGRQAVNLAFVLDRSGSMSGAKIATARQAVEDALGRLKPEDRFSIVVYDDQIDVLAESAPATPEARRRALDALHRVDARGSTNLGEGWLRGCEQVARTLSAGGVNRCLLLTDGLANQGITDRAELERHARELRERGVATTTFGVGADFDERLLQAMADAGGGNFYFIESPPQIRDHMTSEVGESLEVVARDVVVEVTGAEGMAVESLLGFAGDTLAGRPSHPGARARISLGDLVSEQRQSVVVRLNFPYGQLGHGVEARVAVHDRGGAFAAAAADAPASIRFEYADDRTNDLQPRDVDVDRAVARAFSTRVRREALDMNRAGRFTEAAVRMNHVAQRIRSYAGSDPEMLRIVAELETDRTTLSAPVAAMASKAMYFANETMARGRSPEGKAMRGPKA